jgi:thioredoxin reductase (NADPH)
VVVLGSGPAGLTAALYAARAKLDVRVVEGDAPQGQLMLTTQVENYPGFPDGVLGPDLMLRMRAQTERFGATFVTEDVTDVNLRVRPFVVRTRTSQLAARAVIIATGARARMLSVPGESEFLGHGISTCATCDGFFFDGLPVAVVGGGDSAIEEALYLTHFASQVSVIHRRDQLRASKIMQERARANPKIQFVLNSLVKSIDGSSRGVEGLGVMNVLDGRTSRLATSALFLAIGHMPNSQLFSDLERDSDGYIRVRHPRTETSIEGVFACGDVVDRTYRQAVTAAGMGCAAGMDAERYLEAQLAPPVDPSPSARWHERLTATGENLNR